MGADERWIGEKTSFSRSEREGRLGLPHHVPDIEHIKRQIMDVNAYQIRKAEASQTSYAQTMKSEQIFSLRCNAEQAASSKLTANFVFFKRVTFPTLTKPKGIGGARRDRTDDLMLAKHALSQLSYGP